MQIILILSKITGRLRSNDWNFSLDNNLLRGILVNREYPSKTKMSIHLKLKTIQKAYNCSYSQAGRILQKRRKKAVRVDLRPKNREIQGELKLFLDYP